MVWSGLKIGSATVALIAWPSFEVSELRGSSRLAWTIQLPVSVFGGVGWRKRLLPEVTLLRGVGGDYRRRGQRGNLDGVRGFDGPGCALVDALGMVGNLGVDELNEAVTLFGAGKDGDIAAGDAEETVELTVEEASLGGRRWDSAEDGGTVGGVFGGEGDGGSVGENEGGEVDDGRVEGGEVASHAGADAARAVVAEIDDAAGDDGVRGEEQFVVGVDGVDQVSANRLAVAHGKVFVDAEGERGFGGKSAAFGLA